MPDSFCASGTADCSGHGSCLPLPDGSAGCRCDVGYGGTHCEHCVPPYHAGPGGTCVPPGGDGGGCGDPVCSGHGACVTIGGTSGCACEPGYSGAHCEISPFVLLPVGHSVYPGDSIRLETRFPNPGACAGKTVWSIVSGGGSVSGTDKTAPFTAPDSVDGLVDVVTVRAGPQKCPTISDQVSIHVVAAGAAPIVGFADPTFETVDEAVQQFIADHDLPGGVVALSFRDTLVYNKAFGWARRVIPDPEPMTPGHLLRLASVSKPITRAAIRELQAAGKLAGGVNGLNDSIYAILQTEGGNLLGLDDANMPIAALDGSEYSGSTPSLCDLSTPPMCPVAGAPLMCPIGSLAGGLCPLGSGGGVSTFALDQQTWNVDGGNPRVGGTPQYDCPTDDGGGLDVPMWQRMTVADLFWHRGGFYRGAGFIDVANGNVGQGGDPQQEPIYVSQRLALDHAPPPTALDLIHFAAGTCLYYPPLGCDDACCGIGGTPAPVDPWGYCTQLDGDTYSNIGYNILGRVIEVRSGLPYADYVTQTLLTPLAITDIKQGRTRPQDRDPREPNYEANGGGMAGDLFAAECVGGTGPGCAGGTWSFPQLQRVPDGGDFAMEFRDPSGGWTATACALDQLFHTYRVTDGFRRTPGVWPAGGEGTMFGAYPGTRAYVAQWGDPITIVDTQNVPMGCTSWGCLNSASVNFPLGPGWHVAAIFNKDLCDSSTCDAPGGYVFTKHDKQALMNGIAAALTTVNALPAEPLGCGCGNDLREVGEQCDGFDVGDATCTGLGFPGGQLACAADCTYDTMPCELCGNGVVDAAVGEVCDGSDFAGVSCASYGFEMGDLICNSCAVIDPSQCSGGMSLQPPVSYKACGFDFEDPDHPADCSAGTCAGAVGDCAGGPCAPTDPSDYQGALGDPLNASFGTFHPDGNFRSANGTLFFCRNDANDVPMVCTDVNGWGVCQRCSATEPQPDEHHTLVGCPCNQEDDCESPSQPGLACFGEDYGGHTGFCWDAQDGPPPWQCAEGTCGQAPYYAGNGVNDDTMYCEHYPIGGAPAHCEPWATCNPILARVCAGEGLICGCVDEDHQPSAVCAEGAAGCDDEDCCAANCEQDGQCGTDFGWPAGFTCEGPDQSSLVCAYTGGP